MKKPPPPASKPAPPAERDQGEDHEVDFAELMRRVGVKPLAPLASRTPSATTTRAAPAAKPAPTTPTLGQTPQPLASAPSRSTPRESERLASISARCDALITERDSASRERDALIEERDALIEERDALIKERDAAREVALARQRSLEEARALHLREAPVRAPPREDLAAQLRGRGLVAGEEARALALLAEGDALGPLLAQLEARDADAFAALLRRRIALVCDDPACAPAVGAAALSVARARCEVCGGSDIQRSASAFARACEGAGITRVRFVGGSPSYRSKLEELFSRRGHGGEVSLVVRVTPGDQRVRQSRSRSQQRGDDLTIIWGATELDHATSGAYRPEYGRVEVIAHRGIGRMLALAAAKIAV